MRPIPVSVLVALLGASIVVPSTAAARGSSGVEPPVAQVAVRLDDPGDAAAVAAAVDATAPDGGVVEPGAVAEMAVPVDQVAHLEDDPRVAAVLPRGSTMQAALAQSVPLVGAGTAWAEGATGEGEVIVVVDTGVTPSFGGTLVGQACFAASGPPNDLVGHCGPDGDELRAFSQTCFDLGVCDEDLPYYVHDDAAGRPCPGPLEGEPISCAHGSAVAASAARSTAPQGVAPDAGVYAIRVFNDAGTGADLVDVYLALDHVTRLVDAGLDVAAVNLSLSTKEFASATACDSVETAQIDGPSYDAMFRDLQARGVAVTVATGNEGRVSAIGFPACVSSAVAVGSSDLDDRVSPFSNTSPTMDLLAPGSAHGSTRLTIPSGTGYSSWSGTSFSSPHVAGALALAGELYPKASVNQLVGFLRSTAVAVPDGAVTYRRVRLRSPTDALAGGTLFPTDLPVGGSRSAVGDFNGDGRDDVLAHGPGSAPDAVSFGRPGAWAFTRASRAVNGTYVPIVGNFRGDPTGPDDVLWYAAGTAGDSVWTGSPSGAFTSTAVTVNGSFSPVVGDYDGDGWDDVLWYSSASSDYVWYGGATTFTSRAVTVAGSLRVVSGDFDEDGKDDLILHGPGSATDRLWRGTGTRGVFATSGLTLSGSFTLRVLDVDGDGADDLLLYQAGSASDAVWRGGGAVGGGGATGGFSPLPIAVSGTYLPLVGDFDDDGGDDVLWYAPGTATDHVWYGIADGSPTTRSTAVKGTYTPQVGDFDGEDGDDVAWMTGKSTVPVWWSAAAAL